MHVESWREAYRDIVPRELLEGFSLEEHERRWVEILSVPHVPVFVVDRGGDVVAFCCATAPPNTGPEPASTAEISALYVRPAEQRRGHGRRLCERVTRESRARGFTTLTLKVVAANEPARRFYEAMGFRERGREELKLKSGTIAVAVYSLGL